MTLYISQENQTLLWQMIQKTQPFITVFQHSPLDSKTNWFKSQIQKIYQQLPPSINREQLKQINRDTLTNMIQDLTRLQANSMKTATNQTNQIDRNDRPNAIDRPPFSRLSNNSEIKSLTEYETQYKTLLETPKPQVPDFSEKIDDQPIPDMDILIKEHQRQREEELKNFGPPPIIPEQKTPLQIESKDPISTNIKELKDITQRLDSLEKKMNEIIELYKKSQNTLIEIP
jgi:hypothetical protein